MSKSGKKDKSKAKKKKSAARASAEAFAVVIFLVVFIRGWILESFKIPTSSMEPELIGNPYYGDRVIAWKPSVNWSTPSRWSVYVFLKRPDAGELASGVSSARNFIKRMVGMPEERLLITGGNVFVRPKDKTKYAIAKKPDGVQDSLWHAVYDSSFDKEAGEVIRFSESNGVKYSADTGTLSLNTDDKANTVFTRFIGNHYKDDNGLITNLYLRKSMREVSCPKCAHSFKAVFSTERTRRLCPKTGCGGVVDILHSGLSKDAPAYVECRSCSRAIVASSENLSNKLCPHCAGILSTKQITKAFTAPGRYPAEQSSEEAVTDVALECKFTPLAKSGVIYLEIKTAQNTYTAELDLRANTIKLQDKTETLQFAANQKYKLRFEYYDQTLNLKVDGKTLLNLDVPVAWRELAQSKISNAVRIGGKNINATFDEIKLFRDIHYTARANPELYEFYNPDIRRFGSRSEGATAVRTREPIKFGHYVMLGDNSPSSYDGRMWPAVAAKDLMGRAVFLFWPPSNMKSLE